MKGKVPLLSPVPLLLFVAAFAAAPRIDAQEHLLLSLNPVGSWQVVERTDVRRYDSGRYAGLTSREVRGLLGSERGLSSNGAAESIRASEPAVLRGMFMVLEETRRDRRETARRISESVPSEIVLASDGSVTIGAGERFPSYRGFPSLPADPVSVGASWDAPGVLALDPRGTGLATLVPFLARYEYLGRQQYQGRPVHALTARFATRYRAGDDPLGDPALLEVSGRHDVSILLSEDPDRPLFFRDTLDENYRYDDGELAFRGFSLVWMNLQTEVKLAETERSLRESLPMEQIPDVRIERRREGVALTLERLHFIPDRAELLPEEVPRLDAIAAALAGLEGKSFLVIGHTADVGTAESQFALSEERAKRVTDALTERGIDPNLFLYTGRGGTVPVAPNDTEDGRARNRRVEILILEK